MKLPSIPFFKKQAPKEYYLALLLEGEAIRAVVFEETNGTINVSGEGKQFLPNPLDDTTFEELLDSSDKAISQAESSLPDGIQSHKTIFGVKNDWTEATQITKEHLSTLKKLCEELDLEPIGFLVFAEAIAHLLQKQEGAPVSGILVEIGAKTITATLLRAGRVISSQQAPVSEDIISDVDTLFMRFTNVEILPSRIILLDVQKHPRLSQQFTNHKWNKQLPFLHDPQITPLPEGFETQAILFGTATQMGFDMLNVRSRIKSSSITQPLSKEEPGDDLQEETAPEDTFTKDTNDTVVEDQEKHQPESLENIPADNFGFVKDKDVLEDMPGRPKAFHPAKTPDGENEDDFADEVFANIPEEVKEDEESSRLPGVGAQAAIMTKGMQKVFATLKKIPLSQFAAPLKMLPGFFAATAGKSRLAILTIPLVLILLIGGLFWYFLGLHATATLLVAPKIVQAQKDITFSSTDSTDTSSNTVGGTLVPISEDGKVSASVTGKKDVGDKAKGTVTIYNNDDTSHTISGGTTLTSANGLKFVTAKDVTVASASGDIFSGTKPGTTSVDVTASDIGTEYNLPSGTKFAIGSSTIIAAKNDNAFSGGTKKTVTVVSQDDLDKLTKDLTDTLSQKAKQDLEKQSKDKTILPLFLSTDMSNKQFDKKVGDEATSVNLSATINFQALSYSKADLDKVSQAALTQNNQSSDITTVNLSEDINNPTVAKDGKSVTANVAIKSGLLPKIDTTQVAQQLAGKSFADATTALSDVPQLVSVKATLSPNLFFLPRIFPRIASHITVGIAGNE